MYLALDTVTIYSAVVGCWIDDGEDTGRQTRRRKVTGKYIEIEAAEEKIL